jgi:hypothetical protein
MHDEHAARKADPGLRCARAQVLRQMRREQFDVARCPVQRLIKRQGLQGVIRGQAVRTTVSDPKAPCPPDQLKRQSKADRPNAL